MTPRIRGSDVYVVEDLERILTALAGAARRYAGDYGAGYADALRDVAAGVGATNNGYESERVHEVIEYRAERTVERYQAPAPERRFAIRGEREEWPEIATQRGPGFDMTGDDVNITLFNPNYGRLVAREVGYGWIGNDGYTAFWNAADWQQVTVEEARAWGNLVPDDWAVLVRHAYANEKRRQIAGGRRGMLR